MDPFKQLIKWEYYSNLFKIESKNIIKVCPKLTKHHFDLTNLSKMKVKYAVQVINKIIDTHNYVYITFIYNFQQVFSKSMAVGIDLYRNKKYDCFKGSEETVEFTKTMNAMFDALNRRHKAEGIKRNSHDLEVFLCVCVCFMCLCVSVDSVQFLKIVLILFS